MKSLGNYVLVTSSYWAFTLTDGALRMLVLLHFYELGYSALQIAFLFLLYEFCGVITNLVGGWGGSQIGLKVTLFAGLALQIVALSALALLDPAWPLTVSVAYVMGAQALSGVAKDLTKMSSKSAIKTLLPEESEGLLFKWVAVLTGSKNALKGAGFFLGGILLGLVGFKASLIFMALGLVVVLSMAVTALPADLGRSKTKVKFSKILAKTRAVNLLSAARFFLFGSRDIWFVVGLPLYLSSRLEWHHSQVGGFMALWVIGYGIIQAMAPKLLSRFLEGGVPRGGTATLGALILALLTGLIAIGVGLELSPWLTVVTGLALFGLIFAINSSVHSYLILAFTEHDQTAMDVGFYYMSNAMGRLVGTFLSGMIYHFFGLVFCLWVSALFLLLASMISRKLPKENEDRFSSA
jgi:predicted MFS family arabinose efflux permease